MEKLCNWVALAGLSGLLLCASCSQSTAEKANLSETAAEDQMASLASSDTLAATVADEPAALPAKVLVRTAEVKYRVADVVATTEQIETWVKQYGGFTTKTHLEQQETSQQTVRIKADTALETICYTPTADLTLRIPDESLDTLLRQIRAVSQQVEHRTVVAKDVSLQLLSNRLQNLRARNAEGRYTRGIDGKGKKLTDVTAAEGHLLNLQNATDQRTVQNLSLRDQARMSTLTLNLYQTPQIRQEKHFHYQPVREYAPSLWLKAWDALTDGWQITEFLLLAVLRFWFFWVVGGVAFWAYRRYGPVLFAQPKISGQQLEK